MTSNRVIKVLSYQSGVHERNIDRKSTLDGNLGLDSLDRLEIVMALEEEFDILVDDAEIESCATVDDVIKLVERKGAAGIVGAPV